MVAPSISCETVNPTPDELGKFWKPAGVNCEIKTTSNEVRIKKMNEGGLCLLFCGIFRILKFLRRRGNTSCKC